jgi:uncharacterized protein YyaL (SSP411 family)
MSTPQKKSNALIHASSPYLLQHAYNPVEWNEWQPQVLEKATTENKLLIVSIGYAACHWCHVMEHESFENEEVAEWMNGFYVNIKVDREERPDIDAVYMHAAQLTTGRGGWPLNAIALPNGKPVFAGTYFPKDHWIKILEHFAGIWKKKPSELTEVAEKIEEGMYMMETEHFKQKNDHANELAPTLADQIASNIYSQLDLQKGGLDKAPKFPMPCIHDFLLSYNYFKNDEKIKNALHATLVNMMEGGIYDQAGGGFARYSVDEYWFVPHFEKMLYDNGQLIQLYSKAYAFTGVQAYKNISHETIQWVQREMTHPDGLFFSSLDADSEGVEGKFYCFTRQEIENIVSTRADIFCEYFSIEQAGNWEHTNILYIGKTIQELSNHHHLTPEQIRSIIEQGKKELYEARKKRVWPGLDDKCITAWNALTISGMLRAYQFTGNQDALHLAQKALDFLMAHVVQPNGLYFRNYKNNKPSIQGFLDDQALMIEALIEMYRVSWDEKYLIAAKTLLEKVMDAYYDPATGSFFYTGTHQQQPVLRTREMMDNVIPSSNSIMAGNLYMLGHYFNHDNWIHISQQLCTRIKDQALKHGPYFSHWANIIMAHVAIGIEVAITGPVTDVELRELYKIPGLILMYKQTPNTQLPLLVDKPVSHDAAIYICQHKVCGLPVRSIHEAVAQIGELVALKH